MSEARGGSIAAPPLLRVVGPALQPEPLPCSSCPTPDPTSLRVRACIAAHFSRAFPLCSASLAAGQPAPGDAHPAVPISCTHTRRPWLPLRGCRVRPAVEMGVEAWARESPPGRDSLAARSSRRRRPEVGPWLPPVNSGSTTFLPPCAPGWLPAPATRPFQRPGGLVEASGERPGGRAGSARAAQAPAWWLGPIKLLRELRRGHPPLARLAPLERLLPGRAAPQRAALHTPSQMARLIDVLGATKRPAQLGPTMRAVLSLMLLGAAAGASPGQPIGHTPRHRRRCRRCLSRGQVLARPAVAWWLQGWGWVDGAGWCRMVPAG